MRLLWLVACFVALSGSALAQMWTEQATISPTAPLSAGHVCYTDGRDIACDANAPLMSGLGTGSGDRLVSGTLSAIAISNTGYISLTTNGTNWGYLSSAANYLPFFSTSGLIVSNTVLYVSGSSGRVGIGTSAPSYTLHVLSTGSIAGEFATSGTNARLNLNAYGSNLNPQLNLMQNNGTAFALGVDGADSNKFKISTNGSLNTNTRMTIDSSGNVGIGTAAPSATLDVRGSISASTAIQVGSNALTCATGISGTMRYSAVSSTMEYCNGSAWTSMGPSATQPVAFSVTKNADQTVASSAYSKITFDTKSFDTNNNFSACTTNCNSGAQTASESRFTPTVPGKYLFAANAYCATSTIYCFVAIQKNGTGVFTAGPNGSGGSIASVSGIMDMNGTTDYVEVSANPGNGTLISAGATAFSGALLAPQGSGGGGTATPAGSTADVQFNSGGALAADTGIFTYSSGLLKSTSISATNISATVATLTSIGAGNITASGYMRAATISASTAIQIGSNSLTCASGISGTMRYSSVNSTMEYCNGSAWQSLGPSDTAPVAFAVNKNGTDQTVTTNTWTLLTWPNEEFDTNNNFASNRFSPTVRGKYLITAAGTCDSATCEVSIYKNGVIYLYGVYGSHPNVSAVMDMNGSSDYLEAYIYNAGGTNVLGNPIHTRFSGALIGPQGSGGGTATPAGSTADIQFNSGGALAADTGVFTYSSGLLKSTSISATNISATVVTVNGNVSTSTVSVAQGSTACNTANIGMLRRNPTTGKLQVCQDH